MLEKLPDAVGHALRNTRAGLDQTAFRSIDLRQGMGSIALRSPVFVDHGPLPVSCTADGEGISPSIVWTGLPDQAESLLLIVEDADAPMPHPLVHAIVVDLAPDLHQLDEGAMSRSDGDAVPGAAHSGRNSYLQTGWLPPDPPPGHGVHRYAFQLFALAAGPAFSGTPGREAVLQVLRERAVASGCMVGTYERPDASIKEPATDAREVPRELPVSPMPLAGA